jgi:hypothetical protein
MKVCGGPGGSLTRSSAGLRRLGARLLAAGVAALALAACERAPEDAVAAHWGVFERYCTGCHNDAELAGEQSFEHVKVADVAAKPELFEHVVRKLRGRLMPPPGEPRPDADEVDDFVAALEGYLDASAKTRGPAPGRVAVHRLNRTEYATAVRDLVGVDIDARAMLPADLASDGFDNVAEVLQVSPTHLDQYLAAARDISLRAVGNAEPEPLRAEYRSDVRNHTVHVDGLPLGTRDGLAVSHYFPADGQYQFDLNVSSESGDELRGYPNGWMEYEHTVVLTIDGVPVFKDKLGGAEDSIALDQRQITAVEEIKSRFRNIRLDVKAGVHEVAVAFVARSRAEGDYLLQPLIPGEGVPDVPRIHGVQIIGPYEARGISGTTASRERVFICRPEVAADERPCATKILGHLARAAFRRPVGNDDLEPLLAFYDRGRAQGGFDTGVQQGLMAILASTKFLYRAEPGGAPPNARAGDAYLVSDVELAWRLAFFLWSEGPDEALLALAEGGRLHEPAVYEAQVKRMLADPRSESLVTNFAFQWLGVRRLDALDPDPRLYPTFDDDLRNAFREEMRLFLDSVLRSDDASVLDLLAADYTFVNERLARHYGIPSVRGGQFRRVHLDDERRFGLFGKGSVLMVSSYPDRTSPVLRGAWIMEQVVGAPPSPPPPGVETNLPQLETGVALSVRDRLARHRTNPSCNQCHGVIDPLGQALEQFDAVGEWRTVERQNGAKIDSTGTLAGGGDVDGPVDLRNALLKDPDHLVGVVTEKLMTYALGRGVRYYDMPAVREIVRGARRDGYRFSAIVMGIANSTPFRMRAVPEPAEEEGAVGPPDGAAPPPPQGSPLKI